jgi:phosphate uptake regulator
LSSTRKLQKIGASLFISLPKAWAKRMKLEQGIALELVEQPDGTLVLYPEVEGHSMEQTTLNVDASESVRSLRRKITGVYVDGFDVIELRSEGRFSDEQQDAIRDIADGLFGLEITEVASDRIAIQCLLTKTLPIEETIQRVHVMIDSMLSETFSALERRDAKAARSVMKRMRDVNRLSLVMHRLLRSQILFPTKRIPEAKPIDTVDFLRVLDKITEVSGSLKKIIESVSKILDEPPPQSILDPLLEICFKVKETYNNSIQSLMLKDESLANRVLDEKPEMNFDSLWDLLMETRRGRLEENKAQTSIPTFSYVHRIIDNLKQIHIYALEIAEIAIDRAEE